MKKFVLLLMAALALPVMAQNFATKAEAMRSQDRDKMEVFAPVKAFDASAITVADKNRGGLILWDFETDESFDGWMSYDADGDGYGWEIENYYSYNGGTYSLTSRSYYAGTVLYPDNWLISPTVPLDGTLSIFTENYLSSYPEKIKVYVFVGEMTENTTLDDFVPISDFIIPGSTWEEHTFDMSEYEGAMGCFAIRHYDCVDQYRILVDYISIGVPAPLPTVPENLYVEPGKDNAEVTWEDEDDALWNIRYRVYTPDAGFFEDFENMGDTGDPISGDWIAIDNSNDGYTWYIWNPESSGYDSGDGVGLYGTACATSPSYMSYALNPDNWLISPEATLGGTFKFCAAGQDPSYVGEHFAVFVTTGDPNDLSGYVQVSEEFVATSPIRDYEVDLSAFEGQKGHVAIRHFNCYDMFRLNVDNCELGTPAAEWIYVENIDDLSYMLEGLAEDTEYEVQVQATDGWNDSDWTDSFIFRTGEPSAIKEISAEVKGDNRYYNMMGQEVDGNNLPAGIYIHNGKKILVK